eukprot:5350565-Prymnesium_polylepis.2
MKSTSAELPVSRAVKWPSVGFLPNWTGTFGPDRRVSMLLACCGGISDMLTLPFAVSAPSSLRSATTLLRTGARWSSNPRSPK